MDADFILTRTGVGAITSGSTSDLGAMVSGSISHLRLQTADYISYFDAVYDIRLALLTTPD